MTNGPWDDERLDAAYAARSDGHPTPGDLTASTIAAIRSGTRPATVNRRPRILAAAAVVAVMVGGLAIAGFGSRGPNQGAATPSDATAEATSNPTPTTAPSAPLDTWPPAGATIVTVPGVEIAVVDLSNHLLGARTASLDGASLPPGIAAKPIHLAETTIPGELLLTWSGSGCDRQASVTIDKNLTAISVERIESPNCEGDARTYGLILTFDDPVHPDAVELSATRRVMATP